MTDTPARQPQEYIITMGRIIKARNMLIVDGYYNADVLDRMVNLLRARPHTSPPAPAPEEPEITNKMFDFAIDRVYKKGMKDGAKAGRERVLDEVLNAFLERPDDQFIQYIESLRGAQEEQG
jgi:hypothetical protein